MSTPSYIATNPEELFDNAPEGIQDLIESGEVDKTTIAISENYKIPVGDQTALSNIIFFVLIGALDPSNVVQALTDLVQLTEDEAKRVANDLEHSIFEKARAVVFKKDAVVEEIQTLEYKGEKSKEDLRKELLNTTKRESALVKSPLPEAPKPQVAKPKIITPGSRSQLLEQLQVLGTIPNEDEISSRLSHIQEQIKLLKKTEEDHTLTSNIALKSFMFGEEGKQVADPTVTKATFSVPPTKYNVDPYKELVE